jgi:hypothetical protein
VASGLPPCVTPFPMRHPERAWERRISWRGAQRCGLAWVLGVERLLACGAPQEYFTTGTNFTAFVSPPDGRGAPLGSSLRSE